MSDDGREWNDPEGIEWDDEQGSPQRSLDDPEYESTDDEDMPLIAVVGVLMLFAASISTVVILPGSLFFAVPTAAWVALAALWFFGTVLSSRA